MANVEVAQKSACVHVGPEPNHHIEQASSPTRIAKLEAVRVQMSRILVKHPSVMAI